METLLWLLVAGVASAVAFADVGKARRRTRRFEAGLAAVGLERIDRGFYLTVLRGLRVEVRSAPAWVGPGYGDYDPPPKTDLRVLVDSGGLSEPEQDPSS